MMQYILEYGHICVGNSFFALNTYKSDSLSYLLSLVTFCDDWLLFRTHDGKHYELIGRV